MKSGLARLGLALSLLFGTLTGWAAEPTGRIEITVQEKASNKPVPCRIHLKDFSGKPQRAGALPFFRDHFVCPGTVQLELAPGKYSYEIERGPEYALSRGTFDIKDNSAATLSIELERLVNLTTEGWWPGDLHVHRPLADIELLMRAEDLQVAPVITWWNNRNLWAQDRAPVEPLVRFDGSRFYHSMAGEDEREGGALLFFHLKQPLAIAGSRREYPSPMKFVDQARRQANVWIDIEKPFWWDVPAWVASGKMDSIGLANNHMCRDQMYENEAWGKPRIVDRLPAPHGNGYWSQEIYYHLLNCGIRLPPSAGSASGVLPNPVGYNRVYVQVGAELTPDNWWEGLRAGRSFVTNGPLLRVQANGQLPGHIFTVEKEQELAVEIKASLTSREPIRFFEIIKNGQVERKVPMSDSSKTGIVGNIRFQSSGWFLVRAITDNPKTFRFASTAPFYVEVGTEKKRISKSSAQFFLDWTRERMGRIKLEDAGERREVLEPHLQAKKFWQELVAQANAD